MYSALEQRDVLEPADSDWESAKMFFNERKVKRADLGGAGDWKGWNNELDGVSVFFRDFCATNNILMYYSLIQTHLILQTTSRTCSAYWVYLY
jgi:hypothetical protein